MQFLYDILDLLYLCFVSMVKCSNGVYCSILDVGLFGKLALQFSSLK